MDWNETSAVLPEEGLVVDTKIDDRAGCRNEQTLKRIGNLWFYPDGSMYVYYCPTHWKPMDTTAPGLPVRSSENFAWP